VKPEEFIAAVAEILSADAKTLQLGTELGSIEGYDSLGKISLIALVDEKFNVTLSPAKLRTLKTIGDVFALAPK
jgi:acyl carrier protein